MLNRVKTNLRGMSPAYFALVMATGIISIAAHLLGVDWISRPLYFFNWAAYIVLWALTTARFMLFRKEMLADLVSHKVGPGFFTIVAGTCVLGSQGLLLYGLFTLATVLLAIGSFFWIIFTYTIFAALTIKHDKPSLAEGITGGWLLAVVATQSVAVLTALLAAHWGQPLRLHANYASLSMWLWGGMFYIWIISLIFYRYTFFRFEPDDLAPPYWINMGAMAISVLAGSLLIANSDAGAPFLHSTRPFLEGFTIFFWATGTWWIPMIAILAVWRYVYKRLPFEYDPLYWGAVFPLGMYSAATYKMAEVMDLGFLDLLPEIFLGIALAAWLAALVGMIHSTVRRLAPRGEYPPGSGRAG